MHIFCFGDSNTYGYDACSRFGERLPETQRWPELLERLSGWKVKNEGMNGREIPQDAWFLERFDHLLSEASGDLPVDLLVIMLGSNDLLNLYRPDMTEIGERMEQFIRHVLNHPSVAGKGEKILLIAPPPTDIGRFEEAEAWYDREAERFGACYQRIAEQYGLRFADAGAWGIPLAHDGVHFTPEGHQRFAKEVRRLAETKNG